MTPQWLRRASADRSGPKRHAAFTLLELMLVMVLLGVVAGIGLAGFDNIDPGYRALESSLTTFIESSRDRARGSGYPVEVLLQEKTLDQPARMQRAVFRPVLEASFESAFVARERIEIRGDSSLDERGRFGAGLDLESGGEANFDGRGNPNLSRGFSLELDFRDRRLEGGTILTWEGLLGMSLRRGGVLEIVLQAGDGDYYQDVRLELPAETVRSGSWQHLRLTAMNEELVAIVDGKVAGRTSTPPIYGVPRSGIRLGAMERGWSGQIDEILVLARVVENGPELPDEVTVDTTYPLHFDRHGTLDVQRHPSTGVPMVLRSFDDEIASFLIGRFTQEVLL